MTFCSAVTDIPLLQVETMVDPKVGPSGVAVLVWRPDQ